MKNVHCTFLNDILDSFTNLCKTPPKRLTTSQFSSKNHRRLNSKCSTQLLSLQKKTLKCNSTSFVPSYSCLCGGAGLWTRHTCTVILIKRECFIKVFTIHIIIVSTSSSQVFLSLWHSHSSQEMALEISIHI